MNPTTSPVRISPAPDFPSLRRTLAAALGQPADLFVDHDWCRTPAGDVDLFDRFSRWAGQPIGLLEAVAFVAGLPLGVYAVPRRKTAAFLGFLGMAFVPLPDGRIVTPQYARPGTRGAAHPALAALARECHLIRGRVYAADDPDAIVLRMQFRDLLNPVPAAARPC